MPPSGHFCRVRMHEDERRAALTRGSRPTGSECWDGWFRLNTLGVANDAGDD
jgi:hypothetical protein